MTREERRAAKLYREEYIQTAYAKCIPLKDIASHLNTTVGSVKVTASVIGCTKQGDEIYSYRRGFHVPDSKMDDYRCLRLIGGFKARRAAKMLGIPTFNDGVAL